MQRPGRYCVKVVIHGSESDRALRRGDGDAKCGARRSRIHLIGGDQIAMGRELDQIVLCSPGKHRIPVGGDQIAFRRQDQPQRPVKVLLIGEDDEPPASVAGAIPCVSIQSPQSIEGLVIHSRVGRSFEGLGRDKEDCGANPGPLPSHLLAVETCNPRGYRARSDRLRGGRPHRGAGGELSAAGPVFADGGFPRERARLAGSKMPYRDDYIVLALEGHVLAEIFGPAPALGKNGAICVVLRFASSHDAGPCGNTRLPPVPSRKGGLRR